MFKVGDKVTFQVPNMWQYFDDRGKTLSGEVTKINRKTYEVTHWRNDGNGFLCALIDKAKLKKMNKKM